MAGKKKVVDDSLKIPKSLQNTSARKMIKKINRIHKRVKQVDEIIKSIEREKREEKEKREKRLRKAGKRKKKKVNWKVFLVSMIVVYAVAGIGSIFTSNTGSLWYQAIKPSITPPNWVFPIVWTILFYLIGLSIYFVWLNADKKEKIELGFLYAINLTLNILWSYLFFFMQNPRFAFFELILLWISILALVIEARKINKNASWLLVPYLVWVTFAGILNYLAVF